MQDDEPNRSRSKHWIIGVALLVFYVLSVGPVCWIHHTLPDDWYNRTEDALVVVYWPLIFPGHYSEQWQYLLDWYADLL